MFNELRSVTVGVTYRKVCLYMCMFLFPIFPSHQPSIHTFDWGGAIYYVSQCLTLISGWGHGRIYPPPGFATASDLLDRTRNKTLNLPNHSYLTVPKLRK